MPTRTIPHSTLVAALPVGRGVVTGEPSRLSRREANALPEIDPDRSRPAHAVVRALAEVLGVARDGQRTEGIDLDPVAVWREEIAGVPTGRMVLLDGRARVSAYKRANRSRVNSAPRGVPAVIYSGPLAAVMKTLRD